MTIWVVIPKEYRRKYSGKVLGAVEPGNRLSPRKLKSVIGNFTQLPYLKMITEKVSHIEMDFSAQAEGKFRTPQSSAIFDDIYSNFTMDSDSSYDMSRYIVTFFHRSLPSLCFALYNSLSGKFRLSTD